MKITKCKKEKLKKYIIPCQPFYLKINIHFKLKIATNLNKNNKI